MRGSHFLLHYFFPYLIIFSGCAADFNLPGSSDLSDNASTQSEIAASLTNARVSFLYSDYYSLTSPNPATGCAGDAKNYYDAINLSSSTATTAASYATSLVDSTTTIHPLFIKNISVDITDANSAAADNAAQSCSYGTGVTAPPASTCATFDYGAIGGLPSLLGGTLVMFGGMSGINYSGINSYGISSTNYNINHGQTVSCGPLLPSLSGVGQTSCSSSMYVLGVNTLPENAAGSALAPNLSSATEPISTWTTLSAASGYTGPTGASGAAVAYNDALQRILVFGGSAPMAGLGATGAASNTYDTWIFDLKTQTWQYSIGNAVVDAFQQVTADYKGSTSTLSMIPQGDGGRALFGYEALPGAAISQFGSTGIIGALASPIDKTDQIAIVGGYCSGGTNACQDSFLMNPTYGPQYLDVESPTGALATPANAWRPMQWLHSYYERKISNTELTSFYNPTRTAAGAGFPVPSPTPSPTPTPSDVAVSFGMTALRNIAGGAGQVGAGYLVAAGGFHGFKSSAGYRNIPSDGCADLLHCGNFELMHKWAATPVVAGSQVSELKASNFTSVANVNPSSRFGEQGYQNTPARWTQITDNTTDANSATPWFGGGVMLRGLNITTTNEVVFFGGTDCQSYLTNPNAVSCAWPVTKNPGRYWDLTSDPFSTLLTTGIMPSATAMGGTAPFNAGIAAARGVDPDGNPLIVAWGGMNQLNGVDTSGKIYYLYKNGVVPTWGSYTVPSGAGPVGLANASLVYSHVSGKFYLFGGYSPIAGTSSATWELSVDNVGDSASCGVDASADCTFTWQLLGNNTGLTCYPNCPTGRRSHRMIEVNYNNQTTGEEPVCTSASAPCSFGLFMQGGSSDGLNVLNDRWMFDPTANGGAGHWQLMGDMPPRTLSVTANVDYAIPSSGVTVHRAVLFGGETGMQNPYLATGKPNGETNYFVPPTLGDTWMYDYTQRNWNRVQLYGERFNAVASLSNLSELDSRQGSLVTDTTYTHILSPPPLSGAVMVTRTQSKVRTADALNPQVSDPATKLKIPEVFLFGGRTKEGVLHTLNNVYKFCAGSTGEKPYTTGLNELVIAPAADAIDDATCDAYDSVTNPRSPSPTQKFAGRWLKKNPTLSTDGAATIMSTIGSFLGAGTYDPVHDLIISFGGLIPRAGSYSVTNSSEMILDATGKVWEYSPPYSVTGTTGDKFNGSWKAVPVCDAGATSPGFPEGRYGHTLSFNTKDDSLVVVGGYDSTGALITQSLSDGTAIPEIWTGYRIDAVEANGIPAKGIPAITTTVPCYYWKPVTVFGNYSSAGPSTGLAHTASIFIPTSGYSTGYYSTDDQACANVGPISSPDTSINKLLAGGVYIDIDRSQLNPLENVLLNLTFLPLGATNVGSDQNYLDVSETAIFKIHLIHVGESGDTIRLRAQPRYLAYAAADQYPHLVQDLSVFAAPTGEVRQEQVLIPLAADPLIDRIRIERYSGNAILIDAAIYRMGHP